MKQSMRAKRMQRHHKRAKQKAKLSLVSLMDIFTILVFFLMLNASDVQVLQKSDAIDLPESIADGAAKETVLILVTREEVLVQGKTVGSTLDVANANDGVIQLLKSELDYHSARSQSGVEGQAEQAITIMGDNSVTYAMLKQIMKACAATGYLNLALAVENKTNTGSALSSGASE